MIGGVRRLRSRLARLEGGRAGVRMLCVPLTIADDAQAVAAFIAEHRRVTGWRGRLALVAVPDMAVTMDEWTRRYSH